MHERQFGVGVELSDGRLPSAVASWEAAWRRPERRIAVALVALGLVSAVGPAAAGASAAASSLGAMRASPFTLGGAEDRLAAYELATGRVVVSPLLASACGRARAAGAGGGDPACLALVHAIAHAFVERALGGTALRRRAAVARADEALTLRALVEGEAMLAEEASRLGPTIAVEPRLAHPVAASRDDEEGFAVALAEAAREAGFDRVRDALRTGGEGRVEELFAEPPAATAALLEDVGAGSEGELPDAASPDVLVARGDRLVERETIGALAVRTLLRRAGHTDADAIAASWSADSAWIFEAPDGTPIALWLTRWSTVDGAKLFEGALRALAASRGADLVIGRRDSLVVALAHVPPALVGPIRDDLLSVLAPTPRPF